MDEQKFFTTKNAVKASLQHQSLFDKAAACLTQALEPDPEDDGYLQTMIECREGRIE